MIYLDSSALVKLVSAEIESPALTRWLTDRSATVMSSALSRVEVVRAVRRRDSRLVEAAVSVLAMLDLVPLDAFVLDRAAALEDPHLRSLDALHLASALALGDACTAFVAYDARLLDAAGRAGLPTVMPT